MGDHLPPQDSSRDRLVPLLFAFFLLGTAYRVLLALRMPVGYDEVFDISLGLLRMRKSAADLLIEVIVERSNALAPFWWWAQYAAFSVRGELSLFALRIVPATLGLLLLPLSYFAARRHWPKASVQLFVVLICASDVLAFTAARGEFFEPQLLVFLVPLVCMIGAPTHGVLRGFLWTGLVMTHAGKAGLMIALNLAAELVVLIGQRRWRDLPSLALSLMFPMLAIGIWYLAVAAHYDGRPIVHAVGTFHSFFDLLWAITVDYPRYKAHVTGTSRDALQIFMDARVWPLTALAAPLMAFACICTFYSFFSRILRGRKLMPEDWRRVALTAWVVLGFSMVVLRGTAGARFHLVYLPAAWLLTADVLARFAQLRTPVIPGLWFAASVWFGVALSWPNWAAASLDFGRAMTAAGLLIGIGALAYIAGKIRAGAMVRSISWTAAGVFAALAFALGPFAWAPAAVNGSEPMLGSESLRIVDAAKWPWRMAPSQPTENMYVYLAHYFLSQRDLGQAQRYAELGIRKDPDDQVAWFYLGLVYDEAGHSLDERRRIWRRAMELNPGSERVRERWQGVHE